MTKLDLFFRGFTGIMTGAALYSSISDSPVRHWVMFAAIGYGLLGIVLRAGK